MRLHSTVPDFILFLYVHMSHADQNYDPQEMAAIKSKMHTLFPDDTDLEKKLYAAIREYNSFDKSKITELIDQTLQHFGVDTLTDKVYADLYEIIQADGNVYQSETKAFETIKRIIEIHSEPKTT